MRPALLWADDAIVIEAGRTCKRRLKFYNPDNTPAAVDADAVVRFKVCLTLDDDTPLLDIDSLDALEGGSIVEIVSRGTDGSVPAEVIVTFAQNDTAALNYRLDHYGEIGVVDSAETNPVNAFKRAGYGPITVKASPGGNIGLTN